MKNKMMKIFFIIFFAFNTTLFCASSEELQKSIDKTLRNVDTNNTSKAVNEIASKLVDISPKNEKDINETQEIAEIVAQKIVDENISDIKKIDDKKSLNSLVHSIKDLNYQIKILQDRNTSLEDVNELKKDKLRILENIPTAIINQNISYEKLLNYIELRKQIRYRLEKYPKSSKEYMLARIDYYNIEISEIFYTTLLRLEKMYTRGDSKKDISVMLQKSILSLQTKDYLEIKEIYDGLNKDAIIDINKNFQNLVLNKETYFEIFDYLLENVSVLESSAVLNFVNLKTMLDHINAHMNLKSYGVDVGKIVIIVFITLFFYSLRRILAKILLFIFEKIIMKEKSQSEALRIQAVDTIKKPLLEFYLLLMLLIYA